MCQRDHGNLMQVQGRGIDYLVFLIVVFEETQ